MSGPPACHRCKQTVIVARTIPGEQTIRLDPEPTAAGHYEIDWDAMPVPSARRVRFGDVSPAVAAYLGDGDRLYIHHNETCRVLNAEPADEPDPLHAATEEIS
jgi:hypothetical protein